MAQYEGSYSQQNVSSEAKDSTVNGWAVGFIVFASAMMIMVGVFHFITGFAAILDDTFYVVRPGYDLKLDVTTWGWVHMVGGILVSIAGVFLLTGMMWARIIAIVMALISAFWSFYSIPYYPVWSILIIALNAAVLWALIAHGRDMEMDS